MADFKLNGSNSVVRESDGLIIPIAPDNSDYQVYLAWLEEGNTPDPWQTLAQAQAVQIDVLTAACDAQIALGYTSSALSTPHTYPLDIVSQSNMQAAVIRMGMTTPAPPDAINYMCCDSTGLWLRLPHSGAQLMQAALDGMAYIEAVLAKKDSLVAAVNSATTPAAALAVGWSYP